MPVKVTDERPTTPHEEIGRWIARVYRKRFQLCEMMLTKMGIGPGQVPILRELSYHGDKFIVSGGKIGPVTQRLYNCLTDIQWGRVADTHNWIIRLD